MEITLKDIKRIWLTDEAVHLELENGQTGKELFADYPRLKNAADILPPDRKVTT